MFTKNEQEKLLKLARDCIESRFTREPVIYPDDSSFKVQRGVFVTIHKNGDLRGCIGYIKGYKDLVPSIQEMAQSTAFQDPRFPPLRREELKDIKIEISVLSEMKIVTDVNEIIIGRDGLFITHPQGSGLLLPQVPVEWNWDLMTFLKQICCKAGLPPDAWKEPQSVLYRFTAEIFNESD